MKKSSKTQKQMRETIGIDLGDKVSRYCIVDGKGKWWKKAASATR